MSVTAMLTRLQLHVGDLLLAAAHPEAGWTHAQRRFLNRLVTATSLAGDVMVTELVRALRGAGAMKHRYKNFDRMLGEIDAVPVADAQMELFGARVGKGGDWVIPVDLSDIHKRYAEHMEALGRVRDGSTGEINVPGYGLVTACAIDISQPGKVLPLPLRFQVFSPAAVDFVSQPHVWLETLDAIAAATPGGTFALDRECDSGNILDRLLDRKRDFVVRLMAGENSRLVVPLGKERCLVSELARTLPVLGTIEATRSSEDGDRSPYVAEVSFTRVRLPWRGDRLSLCVFRSPDHKEPMVLLTTHRVRNLQDASRTLTRYFARWTIEELHRFAKQAFRLENVRTLTWHRTQNIVAAVAIVMGALAREGRLPGAQALLRTLEEVADRIEEPLTVRQFWGYALLDGLRAAVAKSPILLRACAWLTRITPCLQISLFPRA